MADYTPLTREEREKLVMNADRDIEIRTWMDMTILRYEATVVVLEAEVARLRPLAEVGEAVEGMEVGFGLSHAAEGLWLLWDSREEDDLDETCGPTALAALEALAALRFAKGEDDD